MVQALAFLLLAANPPSRDELGSFVAGIERTGFLVNGKPLPRVETVDGNVIGLRLDGMTLAPDDFRLLGQLTMLRRLSLTKTNITDKDLASLSTLARLEALMLNNTEVSDKAVDELIRLPALRTCCLGSVRITPAGIAKLKEHFPKLSLGYSQRP
jgi:hypothetical protein